jgi:hypothetical protein
VTPSIRLRPSNSVRPEIVTNDGRMSRAALAVGFAVASRAATPSVRHSSKESVELTDQVRSAPHLHFRRLIQTQAREDWRGGPIRETRSPEKGIGVGKETSSSGERTIKRLPRI